MAPRSGSCTPAGPEPEGGSRRLVVTMSSCDDAPSAVASLCDLFLLTFDLLLECVKSCSCRKPLTPPSPPSPLFLNPHCFTAQAPARTRLVSHQGPSRVSRALCDITTGGAPCVLMVFPCHTSTFPIVFFILFPKVALSSFTPWRPRLGGQR